ncbi:MAG: hypothetical protein K1X73_09845 [Bacteroidia bacterium]|nr:hypothetical protein [Bacteroidia bacterium]HMU77251.1 hypothetical protein [Bacteroidia bacterium]HMW11151.1 hypothetical protein [Bacteroidia bacterium]HMY13921.1 hypothetical protein [Bacteroidia bacterium]HMY64549.1 hypothetical protein [Bacteroidia bacterium]
MKKFYFLILSIFMITSSCKEKNKLNDLDWLIGKWEGTARNGNIFYEEWKKQSDTAFVNNNYHFEGDKQVFGGTSKIALRNNRLYYINDSDSLKMLQWEAEVHNPTSMTFHNDKITPYNRITFSLSEQNTWDAMLMGKKDTVKYSLKRKIMPY